MDKAYYGRLLRQYFSDQATHSEREALFEGLQEYSNENEWEELVTDLITDVEAGAVYDPEQMQTMIQGILNRPVKVVHIYPSRKRWIRRLAAAAVIVGVLIGGYWLFNVNGEGDGLRQAQTDIIHDVKAPEKNRAMITLSDGRQVFLDQVGNGSLANVSGVEVIKEADGKIIYRESSSVNRDASTVLSMTYNTLSNPRGSSVIDMQLADGSHVWLNAGSSITYPVVFKGNERSVTIDGEAYFEIAHDPLKPFTVTKGQMQVQVLGTQFNVNAYEDEGAIKVTLLEGRVSVNRKSSSVNGESVNLESVKLVPGQAATLSRDKPGTGSAQSDIKVSSNVDVDVVMAWKNGYFAFDDANVQAVMRQVARWYDVEVSYRGTIPEMQFSGKIGRDLTLKEVLEGLAFTQLKFKIEGKKLIVLP